MRNLRLWAYLAMVLALVGLAVLTPHAWATPDNQGGTVPTPTRSDGGPRPTPIVPPPSSDTGGGSSSQQPNPQTAQTPAATATPAPASAPLQLTVVAQPPLAWPGATLHLTTTLTNRSGAAMNQVVLTHTLSDGLVPGTVSGSVRGSWQGQTLRVELAALAVGESVTIPFSVSVPRTLKAGTVLQTVAAVEAQGIQRVTVQTLLPMPPNELPRTGGSAPAVSLPR